MWERRRRSDRGRQRGTDEDERIDGAQLGEAERQQSAHPVSDDDGGPVQGVVAGDSVVDVSRSSSSSGAVSGQKCARRLSAWPSQPRWAKKRRYRSHSHEPVSSPWR